MSKIKYKFSKIIVIQGGNEIFEASEADSWEEARREVEKGVYDRKLEIEEAAKMKTAYASNLPPTPASPANSPTTNSPAPSKT